MNDPRSTLCKNVWFLNDLTNVDIVKASKLQMKCSIPVNHIPVSDQWRVGMLNVLIEARMTKNYEQLKTNKEQLNALLESLCIS